MKFIFFFSQKFQEKSQSFQIHQDTFSPKFSSRNISLVPKSLCQSLIMALFISSENSEKNREQGSERSGVVSRQQIIVNLASDLWPPLAPSSPIPPPYLRAAKSFGWTRASVPSRPVSSGELSSSRSFPPRPSDELSSIRCSPAPPKPPGSSAWPSYPQSTLGDARHRLERAARVLCRRWTPVSHPDALASSRPNLTKSKL